MMWHGFKVLVAFGLSVWLALDATAATKIKKSPVVKTQPQEMTFQIMRASMPACEPNCPEWIYAEGDIVPGTAARFNQTLNAAGKAPLLLVIESGGGDVRAALNMGRSIRAHKMNVAIGRAYTFPCSAEGSFCTKDLKPKTVARGWISPGVGFCASACTLVLASGVERIANKYSVVGTHQILNKPMFQRIFYREKYLLIHGHKKIISKTITKRETIIGKPTTKMTASFNSELQDYVHAMGVDKSFLDYYAKAPPSSIYRMSESERLATKIVTSELNPEVYSRPAICLGAKSAPNCVVIKK